MTEIIRLDKSHLDGFLHINKTILETLVNPEWYIPMSEYNVTHLFDGDSGFIVYGALVDGMLAGVTLIDTEQSEFCDLCDAIGLPDSAKIGELGACMVLPEYRGKNLMYLMNSQLISKAAELGFDYLVASAHPDNVASNTSLKKVGFECKTTLVRCGHYLRNAYCLQLTR